MNLKKSSILVLILLFIFGLGYNIFNSNKGNFNQDCEQAQDSFAEFQQNFNTLVADTKRLDALVNKNSEQENILSFLDEDFYFFIYKNGELIFWSNNRALPETSLENIQENGQLLIQKNAFYLALRHDEGVFSYVAMQGVKGNYPIVNKYLENSFITPYNFEDNVSVEIAEFNKGFQLKNLQNETVCCFNYNQSTNEKINLFSLVFGLLSLISFSCLVIVCISYLYKNEQILIAQSSLLIASIIFKEIIVFVDFEIKKSILFSPELYASQFFGNSLGDFFINSFLIFVNIACVAFFYSSKKWEFTKITYALFSLVLIALFLVFNWAIESVILDSVISFEINNFTLLSIYTLAGLLIIVLLCASMLLLLFVWVYACNKFFEAHRLTLLLVFFSTCALLLFYNNFKIIALLGPSIIAVLMLIYLYLLWNRSRFNLINLSLSTIFFGSILIASYLSYYNVLSEDFRKSIISNQLSETRDLITEYRFEQIQEEIKKDPYFKKFFVSPLVSSKELQQRLSYLYFAGYLSKYNVTSFAFNLEGKGIKTSDTLTLDTYYQILHEKAQDTYSEWLFSIEQEDGTSNYLSILPIENNGQVSGTLVLELSPKTYHKENLYPELLIEQKTSPIAQYRSKKDYQYAIYKNANLVSQTGEYPFPFYFSVYGDVPMFPFTQKQKDYRLNFYELDEETKVVIASESQSILIPISAFSYVFCFLSLIFLIFMGFLFLFNKYFKYLILNPLRFTFKNKINTTIISITVASFTILGFITIAYFTELYSAGNTDKLIKKQQSVLSSIEFLFEKDSKNAKEELPSNFTTEIATLAQIHSIDINIFNPEGQLIVSSQPGIFGNGLISKNIDPIALWHMQELEEERFIQNEKIGKLEYQSIYVPIRIKSGNAIAYLNLPYFAQKETLRREISKLMVALVNVYVLLLIISIFMAFLISNSITYPLNNISKKLSLVNLSTKNQAIEWQSNDEIGDLVKEYNKMIVQLKESAQDMAKAERESAWREMARQIAHEIKNPLTPMKLGIQYLQRAVKEHPEDLPSLTERVSKTMIEQIDNLSEIASAFSSFAKMPSATKENVDLLEIINNVVDLFNQEGASQVVCQFTVSSATIYADKNQLLSVFNNLVKNAQQACEDLDDAKIIIEVDEIENDYLVKVIDNGVGIGADKISKVFVPNFTTKSSGTGLGLAISKQIIENSFGKIWFESEENKGCTFFVKLPKHHEN